MARKLCIQYTIVIVLLIGLVFALRLYCERLSDAKPIPAETKLGDFEGRAFETNFIAPMGELFNFVVGAHDKGTLKYKLDGTILVRHDDKVVAEFSVAPNTVTDCNWLLRHGLNAYILTRRSSTNVLEQVLQPGKSYNLIVSLNEPLDQPASFWLTYIQPLREYKKRLAGAKSGIVRVNPTAETRASR